MSDLVEERGLVLVVDDDPCSRALIGAILREQGYEITEAESAEEAEEGLAKRHPDCAVLDLSLPGASGTELCRRIRSHPALRPIPILVVTATDDLQSRLSAFEAGADDCVAKPIHPRELVARVRGHMELSLLRSELAALRGVLATLRLVSHEFNNPLQIVLGALDVMRDGTGVEHAELLSMLTEAAESLASISARVVTITQPAFKPTPIGTMLDVDASL